MTEMADNEDAEPEEDRSAQIAYFQVGNEYAKGGRTE